MAENESILEQARRRGLARPSAGMSVPDGYFDDFKIRMAASLPYRAEAEAPEKAEASQRGGIWRKVRPYVYLAAMFAGIWLMLQMFAMMAGRQRLMPFESNPVMAEALSDDDFMFDYFYDDLSSYELVDEFMMDDQEIPDGEEPVEAGAQGAPESGVQETSSDIILPDSML